MADAGSNLGTIHYTVRLDYSKISADLAQIKRMVEQAGGLQIQVGGAAGPTVRGPTAAPGVTTAATMHHAPVGAPTPIASASTAVHNAAVNYRQYAGRVTGVFNPLDAKIVNTSLPRAFSAYHRYLATLGQYTGGLPGRADATASAASLAQQYASEHYSAYLAASQNAAALRSQLAGDPKNRALAAKVRSAERAAYSAWNRYYSTAIQSYSFASDTIKTERRIEEQQAAADARAAKEDARRKKREEQSQKRLSVADYLMSEGIRPLLDRIEASGGDVSAMRASLVERFTKRRDALVAAGMDPVAAATRASRETVSYSQKYLAASERAAGAKAAIAARSSERIAIAKDRLDKAAEAMLLKVKVTGGDEAATRAEIARRYDLRKDELIRAGVSPLKAIERAAEEVAVSLRKAAKSINAAEFVNGGESFRLRMDAGRDMTPFRAYRHYSALAAEAPTPALAAHARHAARTAWRQSAVGRFLGKPAWTSLYMNAVFGAWELSRAANAQSQGELNMAFARTNSDALRAQADMVEGVFSGVLGGTAGVLFSIPGGMSSPWGIASRLRSYAGVEDAIQAAASRDIATRTQLRIANAQRLYGFQRERELAQAEGASAMETLRNEERHARSAIRRINTQISDTASRWFYKENDLEVLNNAAFAAKRNLASVLETIDRQLSANAASLAAIDHRERIAISDAAFDTETARGAIGMSRFDRGRSSIYAAYRAARKHVIEAERMGSPELLAIARQQAGLMVSEARQQHADTVRAVKLETALVEIATKSVGEVDPARRRDNELDALRLRRQRELRGMSIFDPLRAATVARFAAEERNINAQFGVAIGQQNRATMLAGVDMQLGKLSLDERRNYAIPQAAGLLASALSDLVRLRESFGANSPLLGQRRDLAREQLLALHTDYRDAFRGTTLDLANIRLGSRDIEDPAKVLVTIEQLLRQLVNRFDDIVKN